MNARSRQARRTIAQRSASTRAAARIHRRGEASLTTHALAAGLPIREARSVAGSLRDNAKRLGLTGRTVQVRRHGKTRDCALFTVTAVALIATKYKPRKPAYIAARTRLTLAA